MMIIVMLLSWVVQFVLGKHGGVGNLHTKIMRTKRLFSVETTSYFKKGSVVAL